MASSKKKSTDPNRKPLATVSNQKYVNETCDMRHFTKEHPLLSTLISDDGILFECDGEAPAPSKDYGQLQISTDKVVLRWWKITLRNMEGSKYPGEVKDTFEEFYNDEIAQREIWRIFGQSTLDYCINIVCGRLDWLSRLPRKIQILILSFVNLDDIPQISLVSKSLRSLCRDNDLWRIFYIRHYGKHALQNRELIHLAENRGWRHVFFTNRLKLQMQLRRQSQIDRQLLEEAAGIVRTRRGSQFQPSPPTTPRDQPNFPLPSARRHSFATRKEPPLSPRASLLRDRIQSPRLAQLYINEADEAPPTSRRPPSPSSSVRSNAGSVASTTSGQPSIKSSSRLSNRH